MPLVSSRSISPRPFLSSSAFGMSVFSNISVDYIIEDKGTIISMFKSNDIKIQDKRTSEIAVSLLIEIKDSPTAKQLREYRSMAKVIASKEESVS